MVATAVLEREARGMRGTIPVVAVILALTFPTSIASHCETYSTTTTDVDQRIIVIDIPQPVIVEHAYMVIDVCEGRDCWTGMAIYSEVNGIPGLQRNDFVADDTCHDSIPGDDRIH